MPCSDCFLLSYQQGPVDTTTKVYHYYGHIILTSAETSMPHYLEGYDDKGDYKEFNCLIPVRELAMISPQMFNYSTNSMSIY